MDIDPSSDYTLCRVNQRDGNYKLKERIEIEIFRADDCWLTLTHSSCHNIHRQDSMCMCVCVCDRAISDVFLTQSTIDFYLFVFESIRQTEANGSSFILVSMRRKMKTRFVTTTSEFPVHLESNNTDSFDNGKSKGHQEFPVFFFIFSLSLSPSLDIDCSMFPLIDTSWNNEQEKGYRSLLNTNEYHRHTHIHTITTTGIHARLVRWKCRKKRRRRRRRSDGRTDTHVGKGNQRSHWS